MNVKATKCLNAAATALAIAESEEPKLTAYTEVAAMIMAAKEVDSELTLTAIGQRIGKSRQWVSELLVWHQDHRKKSPFSNVEAAQRYRERTVPTRQTDRVEMAEKLLEDPKVVKAVLAKPTVAARGVANAVIAKETAAKKKRAEQDTEYDERRKESLPGLTGRASKIITKIDQWAIELDTIRESLWELDGRTAELVDMAHENLIRAAEANRQELGRPSKLRVIEGSGTRTA